MKPKLETKHRHKIAAHTGYHECANCGARRTASTYKPWSYGYGAWSKGNGVNNQWCNAHEA